MHADEVQPSTDSNSPYPSLIGLISKLYSEKRYVW
jgi:hypothetical protein